MLNSWTCIEVGLDQWFVWQADRKGCISAAERVNMPTDAMWDPQAMAQRLDGLKELEGLERLEGSEGSERTEGSEGSERTEGSERSEGLKKLKGLKGTKRKGITGKKILILLNSSLTSIRLSDGEAAQFPFEEDYIFSSNTISTVKTSATKTNTNVNTNATKTNANTKTANTITTNTITTKTEKLWSTALPKYVSDSLVEMCSIKGVRPSRVQAIDTLEYRMACYFGRLIGSSFWLLIPQKPGIRFVDFDGGIPRGCYFFSNDVDFRVKELTRLWRFKPPQSAVILSEDLDYLWIRDFLEEKSIKLIHPQEGQDFKCNMIEEWIKGF